MAIPPATKSAQASRWMSRQTPFAPPAPRRTTWAGSSLAACIAGTSAANTAVETPASTASAAFVHEIRVGFTSGLRNIDSSSLWN